MEEKIIDRVQNQTTKDQTSWDLQNWWKKYKEFNLFLKMELALLYDFLSPHVLIFSSINTLISLQTLVEVKPYLI